MDDMANLNAAIERVERVAVQLAGAVGQLQNAVATSRQQAPSAPSELILRQLAIDGCSNSVMKLPIHLVRELIVRLLTPGDGPRSHLYKWLVGRDGSISERAFYRFVDDVRKVHYQVFIDPSRGGHSKAKRGGRGTGGDGQPADLTVQLDQERVAEAISRMRRHSSNRLLDLDDELLVDVLSRAGVKNGIDYVGNNSELRQLLEARLGGAVHALQFTRLLRKFRHAYAIQRPDNAPAKRPQRPLDAGATGFGASASGA